MNDLKIYLLDINAKMCDAWQKDFGDCQNVEIVCEEFSEFMSLYSDIDCVVSPANSFGIMNGGYDLALTRYFGYELQKAVQQYILKNYKGEQPVGTSIIVETGKDEIKLIHTPTMRVPSRIIDYAVIYRCMKSTLEVALQNGVKTIVIPAFGACTGGVPLDIVSKMMREAFDCI